MFLFFIISVYLSSVYIVSFYKFVFYILSRHQQNVFVIDTQRTYSTCVSVYFIYYFLHLRREGPGSDI